VRKLSAEDLVKLFNLRTDLEGLAAELAHANATEKSLEPLYRIVDAMREAAVREDMSQFYEHDIRFHQQFWKLAENEFLERALAPLSLGPIAFVMAGAKAPLSGDYVQVASDHAEILDVLRERTPRAARKMMEDKLKAWQEMQMRKFYGENLAEIR
jgi:DNA-binding GntR family transcriptional regulator